MTGAPDPPPRDGVPSREPAESPQPSPAEAADAYGPSERYGPLTLARYRKDDGRALILYADDEEEGRAAGG